MIGLIFTLGSEIVEVRIDNNNVLFRNPQTNGMFATIDNLKLNKSGVIKEFPELENEDDWQNIAREKFKQKIKGMNTEMEKAKYITEDLKKHAYKPLCMQRQGHRPEKIK